MQPSQFDYSFRIALHDTDAAGVLFFAHLFRHAHDAYERFMQHLGYPLATLIETGERHLPLVHAEADYQAPLRHGMQVHIRLQVARLGQHAFDLEYGFTTASGKTAARARTVHVCIDPSAGTPAPLPESLRAALAPYQAKTPEH